jgi:uncharacterized protein
MLQIRRFKDIVAFRQGEETPVAFHARNMELAEISEDAWQSLASGSFLSAEAPDLVSYGEASSELREWESDENPEVHSDEPLKFTIRSLTINVTQICNLHCTYCAAGGDGTYGDAVKKISVEKTLPQIRFFLDQLGHGSAFHISFLGGEPMLYPEALKAIADYTKEEALKKNISVTFKITTNGTLLSEKNIAILNDIGTAVDVSLDGPAAVNDSRRPDKAGRGATEKIIEGIERLAALRKNIPYIELHSVMDPQHYDVEGTYEFFKTLPVDRFEFTFSVNETSIRSSQLFVESFEQAAEKAFRAGGEKELRRFRIFDRYFDILDNQERIENHCGLGKTLAVIDARNRIFNCPWTVGDKANQIGDGIDMDYDQLEKYSKSQVEANQCQSCWARFVCGGGCSFVHESLDGKNMNKKNDFCFRTRYLTALALRYYSLIRGNNEEEKGEPDGRQETH